MRIKFHTIRREFYVISNIEILLVCNQRRNTSLSTLTNGRVTVALVARNATASARVKVTFKPLLFPRATNVRAFSAIGQDLVRCNLSRPSRSAHAIIRNPYDCRRSDDAPRRREESSVSPSRQGLASRHSIIARARQRESRSLPLQYRGQTRRL